MISLPISLKRKKKRSRCHYGSGRNPRLVRPRRYKAEQMSRSVKNEEKRRLTAAPLSCLFSSSDNVYRKCLANGTWALKGNYSMCKAILHEEVRPSYECMSWLTRRFHTEPSKHETYINQKKKKPTTKGEVGSGEQQVTPGLFIVNMDRGLVRRPAAVTGRYS